MICYSYIFYLTEHFKFDRTYERILLLLSLLLLVIGNTLMSGFCLVFIWIN